MLESSTKEVTTIILKYADDTPLYAYMDIDDAIKRANALDVSFQAAVYTTNLNTTMHTSN